MLRLSLVLCLGFSASLATAREDSERPVQTVSFVDLERYTGKWYEVARFPTRFQRDCIGATADYELIGDDFKGSSITVPTGAEHIPGLTEELKIWNE